MWYKKNQTKSFGKSQLQWIMVRRILQKVFNREIIE